MSPKSHPWISLQAQPGIREQRLSEWTGPANTPQATTDGVTGGPEPSVVGISAQRLVDLAVAIRSRTAHGSPAMSVVLASVSTALPHHVSRWLWVLAMW